MSELPESPSTTAPGLAESFKALLLTFVSSLHTRFEIVTTEIEEERERLEELVILGVASIFCLCMGILLVSMLIVAIFWYTEYRIAAFGAVTAFYIIIGAGLGLTLRAKIRNKPRLFATTLAELAKDRDSLANKK